MHSSGTKNKDVYKIKKSRKQTVVSDVLRFKSYTKLGHDFYIGLYPGTNSSLHRQNVFQDNAKGSTKKYISLFYIFVAFFFRSFIPTKTMIYLNSCSLWVGKTSIQDSAFLSKHHFSLFRNRGGTTA